MDNESVRTAPAIVFLVMGLFYHMGESAPSVQPIRITGRVLENRQPFAGARIELYPAAPAYETALRQLAGEAPVPLKSTATGTDGAFELLVPESGAYRVVVQAKDRLALEHLVVPAVDEISLPPAELMRPSTLAIQALGPDGRPLAGLPLRVARSQDGAPWRQPGWQPAERQGVTGPDGKLALPRWKLEPLNVYVTDPLYLGQAASGVRGDSVTVRPESRPRTVEVLGAQGEPVAGALLRWRTWPVGVTGAGGRMSMSLPGDGAPPLLVEGPGGERAQVSPGVEPVAGVLVVRLAPPEAVTGKVADAGTGKPIAGALVWSGLPPDLPPVRTAEDGTFRLPMLAADRSFGVSARGYETSGSQGGSAKAVAMALKRTATIRGQVVDTAGAPVAGASVLVRPGPSRDRNLSSPWYMAPPFSGADGGFSVPGLLPGGVYKLAAHRRGYGRSEIEVRVAPGVQPTPARIVLGSGATVIGRIVDESGNPVEGAEVLMLDPEMPDPGGLARTTSDPTGAFSIPHLVAGTFQVFARRPGYALSRAEVVVPEGDARIDAGEIVLEAGSAIEGRVTDARGRAVEGAEIRVSSELGPLDPAEMFAEEAPPPQGRSDPDGLFRIEDLERGRRYFLSVRHPAHPHESVPDVEAPTAEPIRIELQPARSLLVRVLGPEGEPVPDAEIQATHTIGIGSSSRGPLGRSDAQGELRANDLKPGPLDLVVTARGYQDTWWKGVQVPQDRDPEPVTVRMERGAVLEGRAVDEGGNPVAGARIVIHSNVLPENRVLLRSPFDRPTTDADGLFRIDDLAPGEHTVSGSVPGTGQRAEATVRLGPGTTRLVLRFEGGIEIAGRVVDEEGQPIPFASIHVESSVEGQTYSVGGATRADGSFLLSSLREGEYRLTAFAKGYGRSEPLRLLAAGPRVEGIEIRLSPEAGGAIAGRVLGLAPDELSRVRVEARMDLGWDSPTSRLDEQGRYRLSGLRSGRWRVMAFQPNSRAVQQEVAVEPGAEVVLDLQFPEGLTFSGRVSLDGRPLAGAEIAASSLQSEPSYARARSDVEGRFSLGPLQPGPHSILVQGAALGTSRTVQLQEGQEIRLDIETGGLQGRILAPDGEPVPDAAIQLRIVDPAAGRAHPGLGPSLRSDAQGAFEMLSIPTGLYTVVVQKPGFEEAQAQVEIRPGAAGVQDLVIKPRE